MPSCATTRPIQTTGRTNPGIHRFLPVYSADQPETHDVIAEMRKVIDQYDERVLIGEIYLAIEGLVTYYGKDLSGAHLPFNFQLIHTAWTASAIAKLITDYEAALPPGGWPNWVLGITISRALQPVLPPRLVGGRRRLGRKTRRTPGLQSQGRLAPNGSIDERKAARGVRPHQAQGPAAEEGLMITVRARPSLSQ